MTVTPVIVLKLCQLNLPAMQVGGMDMDVHHGGRIQDWGVELDMLELEVVIGVDIVVAEFNLETID